MRMDETKKESGDTLSSRNPRIEAGWLARLELGDDGMMERYLTLFFFEEDLKFVFPGRREGGKGREKDGV